MTKAEIQAEQVRIALGLMEDGKKDDADLVMAMPAAEFEKVYRKEAGSQPTTFRHRPAAAGGDRPAPG